MSDLRKAALSLAGHAWLLRFERADETNGYNHMSATACNDISGYVKTFIDMVLAEHPADDDEAVTEEWLESVGFKHRVLRSEFGYECMSIYLKIDNDDQWFFGTDYGHEFDAEVMLKTPATRGDLRRLCKALGIELKEAADVR